MAHCTEFGCYQLGQHGEKISLFPDRKREQSSQWLQRQYKLQKVVGVGEKTE